MSIKEMFNADLKSLFIIEILSLFGTKNLNF